MVVTIIKWIIRILPLGYLGLIWLQSQMFNPSSLEALPRVGYMLEMSHLFLFGFLYILIILALLTFKRLTLKMQIVVLVLTFILALGDEVHQYYVPYRSASIIDMVKNTIGIIAAWCLVGLTHWSLKK